MFQYLRGNQLLIYSVYSETMMTKAITIATIAYGFGAIGVGAARAASNYDAMGITGLMQDAFAHGALWPSMLVRLVV